MKNYLIRIFSIINPEALIWISGILVLAFLNVDGSSHFSVCPFKNIGIDFCPGCGLGKSIHYLLSFEIEKSLNAHPLGLFAFAVLIRRIYVLLKFTLSNSKKLFTIKTEYKYDQSFTTNA